MFRRVIVLIALLNLAISSARCDETLDRYFDQLRQRGLFSLAESEAISRLAATDLSLATRTSLTIELSRSLTEHAGFVSDEQRNELWQRARSSIQDLLDQERTNPRSILLDGQLASVFVAEGEWLRAERELRPFDEPLLNQARGACSKAIEQLQSIEKALNENPRETQLKKPSSGAPLGHELRTLLHQVRFQLGQSYRNRAELSPPRSIERTKDLIDAEQSLRRVSDVADQPVQWRARLLLAVCSRLKNDLERASEYLTALEKSSSKANDAVHDEMTAERVRLLIELKRPTDAAELLLTTRSRRQRLSGELWLLQTRVLIKLREITLEKQQSALANQMSEQIVSTIDRCDDQVGGFWGRRCHQLWENAQTAQKYGAELDSLMQQARADFTAGRIDVALAGYATAEKTAAEKGQTDLAMELGFTRASILLDAMKYEPAAAEFLRLASQYANNSRAAKTHLLGSYCLGRLYDEKKTRSRREAYTDALDRHIRNYSADATVNDARFLKAQLEEQRLQATLALPLYLQVESGHPRSVDAMAGAARCYETILRRMNEKGLPTTELDQEAIVCLTTFLNGDANDPWNVARAEIALRLAAILLMEVVDGSNSSTVNPAEKPVPSLRLDRYQQADRWLQRVSSFADQKNSETVATEFTGRLRQQVIPLRIVALTGIGNLAEAERYLNTLSASPSESLIVIDRLSPLVTAANGESRIQIATMQLRAAERLLPLRKHFTVTEQAILDRCLLNASVAAGQLAKTVETAQRLAEDSAKDVEKQRELAIRLAIVTQPEAQSLVKQCWRRVESLTKAGSTEWLAARLGVLKTCLHLQQFDEGRKLLQVTKVLYPELGGEGLKSQFTAIEKELESSKDR